MQSVHQSIRPTNFHRRDIYRRTTAEAGRESDVSKDLHGPAIKNEASYGFGWARVQPPGRMGQIGINPHLMPERMPVVGKGVPSRLVIFHKGSMPGTLALNMLVPDTESAIFITPNALFFNDVPDWVGQLLLEEFLEVPTHKRNDYIAAAKISAATHLRWYPDLVEELERIRMSGPLSRNLSAYAGTYWDKLISSRLLLPWRKPISTGLFRASRPRNFDHSL